MPKFEESPNMSMAQAQILIGNVNSAHGHFFFINHI